MEKEEKKKDVLLETHNKNVWESDLDAKRYLLEINGKLVLGPEFKKSTITGKEKELIITMLPSAQLALDICPNKSIGREIANMDMQVIHALPILNFNSPSNHVLNRYTQYEQHTEENEGQGKFQEFVQKMTQTRNGEKQPRIEYD